MDKLISVVVPMYFEEEVITYTYDRLTDVLKQTKYRYEIIFVDDGSLDNTFSIVKDIADKDKNVKIIKFSRNFGHQSAVTAGIFESRGDAVILIDADLQDPPEVILEMINLWEDGVMVCYGKRKKRNGESAFKLVTAKAFYRVLDYLSDIKIPTDTGDFRLMDRKVVEAFKQMPEHNQFVRGMVSFIGFRQEPVYYERDERFAGVTKYPLKKMIKFATNGIISFSNKPLQLIQVLAVFSLIVSIFSCIFAVHKNINTMYVLSIVSFFSSLILYSIAIVGVYISRIYDEEKNRPRYLIEDKINFN